MLPGDTTLLPGTRPLLPCVVVGTARENNKCICHIELGDIPIFIDIDDIKNWRY